MLDSSLIALGPGTYVIAFDIHVSGTQRFDFSVVTQGGASLASRSNVAVTDFAEPSELTFTVTEACQLLQFVVVERDYKCSRFLDVRIHRE